MTVTLVMHVYTPVPVLRQIQYSWYILDINFLSSNVRTAGRASHCFFNCNGMLNFNNRPGKPFLVGNGFFEKAIMERIFHNSRIERSNNFSSFLDYYLQQCSPLLSLCLFSLCQLWLSTTLLIWARLHVEVSLLINLKYNNYYLYVYSISS